MNTIAFLREGLKNLKTVGTVTRSSRQLCEKAVSFVDFSNAEVLVELGAGDGVITKHLLKHMRPDARLLAFEVNPKFCALLRDIGDDRLIVVEDSAEHIGRYLRDNDLGEIDDVVSAIPFVALPKEAGQQIVTASRDHLKMGGHYIQVHYSLLMKSLYEGIFGNVDVNFVPMNLPPAFLLVSERR